MKKTTILTAFIAVLITLTSITTYAQSTGTITGMVTDKEFNNEPLPQANVLIKGTQKGTVTDFDGLYTISNVEAGSYTLEFSFVGYETKALPVTVVAGETAKINIALAGSAVAMDEVVIKAAPTKRESETALLVQQKKAVEIKESIGAQQLAKLGVSNAAAATTKISGVTKSEGSGDVFVRGLGDRYLYTTLNGLPIPSDDVERKNIDLGLFPTSLIGSVDVSKTTSAMVSADQASGTININSKEVSSSGFISVGTGTGVNSNIFLDDTFNNFKVTPNVTDYNIGFYNKSIPTKNAMTEQTWNTGSQSLPINRSLSLSYGKKLNDKLGLVFSANQSASHSYNNGIFKQYNNNALIDSINDVQRWNKNITTSVITNLKYKINEDRRDYLKFNGLLISKLVDDVYEGGRLGNSLVFEEEGNFTDVNQFQRDLNTTVNLLVTGQLHGEHTLLEDKNTLSWSVGYNRLKADQPNRIRNEVNFNKDTGLIIIGFTGALQQFKSEQYITDNDVNAKLNDHITVFDNVNEEDNTGTSFKINIGGNFRNKIRDFKAVLHGMDEVVTNSINPTSIDDLSSVFTSENILNGTFVQRERKPDLYTGKLQSIAGYSDFNVNIDKLFIQAGLRYQRDLINVDFDVNNYPNGKDTVEKLYEKLYPSINLKYSATENFNIRFSNSYTNTLPEFKEIAPFEYVQPTGQAVRGNPRVIASTNTNYDLKFEYFLSKSQLVSFTGFYKEIEDPINKVFERGAAEILSYFNTSNTAIVKGLEAEARINIISQDEESETPTPSLKLNMNASRIWHSQDLKTLEQDGRRSFRYNNLTKIGLQGASDWITNVSLNYSNNKDNAFEAAITGNYASDKIFSLGNATIQSKPNENYNDAIVEKGFVILDLVLNKRLNEKLKIGLVGKNLLNPEIKRTQDIRLKLPSGKRSANEIEKTVMSYKRGASIGISLNYKI